VVDETTVVGRAVAAERRRLRRKYLEQITDLNDQIDELRTGAPAQELTTLRQQVGDLTPKATRLDQLEATVKKLVDERKKQLPEALAKLLPAEYTPEKQLEWLEQALGAPAGSFGQAAGGNGPTPPPGSGQGMTKEQLEKLVEDALRGTGQYPRVG